MSMRKHLLRISVIVLCLCLFLGMGITTSASEVEARFAITITPPGDRREQPAQVTIRVEDVNGTGFEDAQVKLGEDGQWQDITDCIRRDGLAHFVVNHSGRVYVSITDNAGIAHVSSRSIEVDGIAPPTSPPTQISQTPPPTQPVIPMLPPETITTPPTPTAPVEVTPTAPSVPESTSVTPIDGTGTVIENSIQTPEVREFFTITTERGGVFYLVVDRARPEGNVYLLSEVTEEDLTGFVRQDEPEISEPPPPPPVVEFPVPQPEVPDVQPEPQPPASSDSSSPNVFLIIIAMLAFGGVGYYFKVVRPKQQSADPFEDDEDDYEEADSPDSDGDYDYDDYNEQDDDEKEE